MFLSDLPSLLLVLFYLLFYVILVFNFIIYKNEKPCSMWHLTPSDYAAPEAEFGRCFHNFLKKCAAYISYHNLFAH